LLLSPFAAAARWWNVCSDYAQLIYNKDTTMPPGLQDGSGPSSAFYFAPSLDPLRFGERNTATLELLSPVARSLQQVGWGLRLVAPMGLLFGIAVVLCLAHQFSEFAPGW
jgi:hypothetical protein